MFDLGGTRIIQGKEGSKHYYLAIRLFPGKRNIAMHGKMWLLCLM